MIIRIVRINKPILHFEFILISMEKYLPVSQAREHKNKYSNFLNNFQWIVFCLIRVPSQATNRFSRTIVFLYSLNEFVAAFVFHIRCEFSLCVYGGTWCIGYFNICIFACFVFFLLRIYLLIYAFVQCQKLHTILIKNRKRSMDNLQKLLYGCRDGKV